MAVVQAALVGVSLLEGIFSAGAGRNQARASIKSIDEEMELLRLWSDPFVMQKMDENMIPSVFAHTNDGKILSPEKYKEICEWFNQRAIEYNEKADEYNKKKEE